MKGINIARFCAIYESDCLGNSSEILDRWDREKSVNEPLNTSTVSEIVLDDLLDHMKSEFIEAFTNLEEDRLFTAEEVREKLIEIAMRPEVKHYLGSGFLACKDATSPPEFLNDAEKNSSIRSDEFIVDMAEKIFLRYLKQLDAFPKGIAAEVATCLMKEVLKMLRNRQTYVGWLREENKELRALIESFS